MKKIHSPYDLLALLLLLSIISPAPAIAQTNALFYHLPPDADKVYHINLPVLTAKLRMQDIAAGFPPPKQAIERQALNLLKDPAAKGIDIKKDLVITETSKAPLDSAATYHIIFYLADSAKFITFLKNDQKGLKILNLPGKVRAAGTGNFAAVWNDHLAVITIITPSPRQPASTDPGTVSPPMPNYYMTAARKGAAALEGFTKSFYTTDATFIAGFSDDADFQAWVPQGIGFMPLLQKLLRKNGSDADLFRQAMRRSGMHSLTSLRFDAGKVVMHSETRIAPDTAALLAKLTGRPIDTDLIRRLPGGALIGMIDIHFDPIAIGQALDNYRLRARVDSMLVPKGLTANDVIQSLKGDFVIAALTPAPDGDSSVKAGSPLFYFVMSVNDRAAFMNVTGKLRLLKGKDTSAMAGSGAEGKFKTAWALRDDLLVLSSTQALADNYFEAPGDRSTGFVTAQMRSSVFNFYINFKSLAAMLPSMPDPARDRKMLPALQALDKLTFTMGAVSGNKLESDIELTMTDPNENSLKTIFKIMHP